MAANFDNPDKRNDLERRLSSWTLAADGLDGDAMLFAAGRASVRSGRARFLWPVLACAMTALAAVLAVCLHSERRERLALAQQIQQLAPAPRPEPPSPAPANSETLPEEEPSPSSLLVAHRLLEDGSEDWPVRTQPSPDKSRHALPAAPILLAGQRDVLLDP